MAESKQSKRRGPRAAEVSKGGLAGGERRGEAGSGGQPGLGAGGGRARRGKRFGREDFGWGISTRGAEGLRTPTGHARIAGHYGLRGVPFVLPADGRGASPDLSELYSGPCP